jgi:hypothetical protein
MNIINITGGREKLPSENLHNLYSSPNVITTTKNDLMGGECKKNGRDEKCIRNSG